MINEIKKAAQNKMDKSIGALKNELSRLRSGRAHPSFIEQVKVDYYGVETPLSQVASIAITDPRTLTVTPWEKTMIQAVEKAIMIADLGLNPATSGQVIRVPMPALTEERRRDMIKVVRSEAEQSRVSIRNIRREANSQVKELLKEKEISEDDDRRAQDLIQKLTDQHIKEIDSLLAAKEADLMEV